jgi:DNA polymerase-3 subunit delta'
LGAALLSTVRSQTTALETLRRALAGQRVHHAYLFDGPDGVGKERAAFGLAQALVCEERPAGSPDACGVCRACVRAVPHSVVDPSKADRPEERRPIHPDVVALERGLYDPALIGRRTPEAQELSIDQVRTLVLARTAFAPYEGRAKVFVVRRAEELSAQAANALLKTLEEPGKRTHFVLLSSAADSLLPTILSRTQRVRFAPLPDETVTALLVERGIDPQRAASVAPLAAGSMTTAWALADADESARRGEFLARAAAALEARELGAAFDLAEEAKKADKRALVADLEALAARWAAEARAAAASPGRTAAGWAERHALARAAIDQIEANASPQLAVEAMFMKMRAVGV